MNTKYPILLVHGLGMKDTFFMKSFGKIDRILKIQGYTVIKSRIDGFGSVTSNATQLRDEIERLLIEHRAEKVNIIAHSKGGLDTKYMLDKLDMEDKVASFTSICVPHAGSPIASLFLKVPGFLLRYAAFFVNLFYRILGDKHPDAIAACEDLKRVPRIEEEAVAGGGKVFCQSFSSTLRDDEKYTDFIMGVPATFSRLMEKHAATDGLVPRDSAIYGVYRGDCIDGSVSHTEIVDFMVPDKRRDRIYAFYSSLCEELVKMGM